jgi:hypothetical protein
MSRNLREIQPRLARNYSHDRKKRVFAFHLYKWRANVVSKSESEAKILRRFSVRITSARSLGAPQIPSPVKLCRAQEGDNFVRLYVRLMDLHSFRHNFCWQLIELGVPRLAILTVLSCDDCRAPGMARRRSRKTSSNLIGLRDFLSSLGSIGRPAIDLRSVLNGTPSPFSRSRIVERGSHADSGQPC